MPATIVSDTSCLILLDKIGEISLLQKLYGQVAITQIVADEFGNELPHWIHIQNPGDTKYQRVLEAALDKGEASSIALALEQADALLIMDELRGRKLAKHLGLTVTGTLGVLAQAKISGHITALKPLLEKVKRTDFRLSEPLVQQTLKEVGE